DTVCALAPAELAITNSATIRLVFLSRFSHPLLADRSGICWHRRLRLLSAPLRQAILLKLSEILSNEVGLMLASIREPGRNSTLIQGKPLIAVRQPDSETATVLSTAGSKAKLNRILPAYPETRRFGLPSWSYFKTALGWTAAKKLSRANLT